MPSIQIVAPRAEFITPKFWDSWDIDALKLMEECGRVSHKSEGRITAESAAPFLKSIAIKLGHQSIIEHAGFTVCFVGSRSMSHQLVRHRIGAYCVTGDTELVAYAKPGNSSKRWTIEQLYRWQDDPKRKGRLRLINLRSVSRDGIIVPGKIKKIVDTGIQHIFQVKTRCNKTLRCTDNEWFMTSNGWKHLHELSVGDRIKVNGNLAYRDEEWLNHHYIKLNMQRTEVAELAGVSDTCIGKWINKYNLQKPHDKYPNRQVDRRNHHWKSDKAGKRAGQSVSVVYSTPITSILACGIERTYDIEMDTPNPDLRNYIAGGFLVHNTQESQRYCDYSDDKKAPEETLQVIMPPSIMNSESLWGYRIEKVFGGTYVIHTPNGLAQPMRPGLCLIMESEGLTGQDIENAYDWCKFQISAYESYLRAREMGIPAEDARSNLTNACKTEVYATYNFRMWRHVLGHPSCGRALNDHAQWEIRKITLEVLDMFLETIPVLFDDLGKNITFDKDELFILHQLHGLVATGTVVDTIAEAGMTKTARNNFWKKINLMKRLFA